MHISSRHPDDPQRLRDLIAAERSALQRDRLRCVLLALEGQQTPPIAAMLGRSRRFVQAWVYAYRDGGIESVRPRPPGRGNPMASARCAASKRSGSFKKSSASPTPSKASMT